MLTRILTISDLPYMHSMIENVCVQSECEFSLKASSGRDGFETFGRFNPDLVFIDLTVLGQSRIDSLQAMRDLSPDIVIIVCASWGLKPLLIQAALRGAKEFLFNPIQPHQVQKVIRRYA